MNKNTEIIATLEQFETLVANFGPIVASYYLSLIKNGVPSKLAYQLTLDWHKLFWEKQLNPENGK